MKKKKKVKLKKIICNIFLICLIVIMFFIIEKRPTSADSGFGTSHSSSSSSHSSSSSSHSSSHSSSYSSGRSHSSSSSSDSSIWNVIEFIVISFYLINMIIAIYNQLKNKNKNTSSNKMNIQQVDDTVQENKIKNIIPNFDKTEFLKQGFKIYTDVQEAWMNFELEKVRDKITDELYSMYESQLATLEIKGEQNIMKDMVNKYCYVKDVSQQNNVITITTGYYIEQYDYIADAKTGKLIRGESKKKMRVKYEMKFRKIIDTNNVIEKCPNCGAKMDINSGGICEYCGSKVVSENSDWVLTEKTVLRQDYI